MPLYSKLEVGVYEMKAFYMRNERMPPVVYLYRIFFFFLQTI